jgi:lactate dehydrogenase-like 2-hydroxyacid dehydrogenase
MRTLVVVTDRISDPDIERDLLGSQYEVVYLPQIPLEKRTEVLGEAYALLVWHSVINKEVISKLQKCRIVIRYGSGVDNLDLSLLKESGIVVANCPDYGVDEVADSASAMILYGVRQLGEFKTTNIFQSDSWGAESKRELRRTRELPLGIIGLGRIGTAVALRMKSFGMQVGFYDPFAARGLEKSLNINRFETVEELIFNSKIITLHCPLTPITKEMVNSKFLGQLNPNTILINTARGGLIKSLRELDNALESGHLGFLGMDVLPEEPPKIESDIVIKWQDKSEEVSKRVLLTPHIAYYSVDSLTEIRAKAVQNLINFVNGQDLVYRLI